MIASLIQFDQTINGVIGSWIRYSSGGVFIHETDGGTKNGVPYQWMIWLASMDDQYPRMMCNTFNGCTLGTPYLGVWISLNRRSD